MQGKKRQIEAAITLLAFGSIVPLYSLFAIQLPMKEIPSLTERGFHLNIILVKTEYRQLESIEVTYWLENRSPNSQFYSSGDDRFEIEVYSEVGSWMGGCYQRIHGSRLRQVDDRGRELADYQVVGGNSVLTKQSLDLLSRFGHGAGECLGLPCGRYVVTCPQLPSDSIWFEVVEPGFPDDEAAAALYEMAMSHSVRTWVYMRTQDTYGPCKLPRSDLLTRLLTNYNQLYFARRAYSALFLDLLWLSSECRDSLSIEERRSHTILASRYIRHYTYDPRAWQALRFIEPSLLPPEERDEILLRWQEFIGSPPNWNYSTSLLQPLISALEDAKIP